MLNLMDISWKILSVLRTIYIHNRISHNSINQQIPYELLYNEKVDDNKFEDFGCLFFYYVPKQFRKQLDNSTSP